MRSPRAAAMIALASATGQARTLPASRTSAGVSVTGGSVGVKLLRRQLDLVTGTAALLAVDMRERAPFARALGLVAGQAQDLESLGEAIVPKPAVHATRLGISAEQLLAVC